ncbi:uroporphyrinogen-III synthase [Mesorhizobium helmanticense]|uniref:Uroporphyrinogen-III synthase n=1 Tax=Mesorhizobium helmanticense TaxID=1776423 RepID=A0A2T4IQT3_9HYPH|nr:uroporphyrinogen-III synthase [Mesorhizobium helmanticense]PTE07990.1 uroporphyrinogen III synthase [Mesorhizobium helmanticense]
MVRVLVTRPEPGASRTARRLRDMGFQPILLPLTETVPVDAGAVPDDAVAVAVTSANALRHAPKALIAALAALPCHAVGKRTAQAAREAGFVSVSEGSGDAEALADALAASLSGKTIAYLCGRVRFATFEERLEAAAVHVRAVETYDTLALDYSDGDIIDRLVGQPVETVLLYSAKAAVAMQTMIERPKLHDLFDNTRFLALSGRIAAALGGISSERMQIAKEPSEEALLALLQEWR